MNISVAITRRDKRRRRLLLNYEKHLRQGYMDIVYYLAFADNRIP